MVPDHAGLGGGASPHADVLRAALGSLPPRQRAVVEAARGRVLRHYRDLPEREIAEVLGGSVGTVNSQHVRALEKLRRRLAEKVKQGGNVPKVLVGFVPWARTLPTRPINIANTP